MTVLPTWKDVQVSPLLVEKIKKLKPSIILNSLIHQLVFRNEKRVGDIFRCDACFYTHTTFRHSDEMLTCYNCGSEQVSSRPTMGGLKDLPNYYQPRNRSDTLQNILDAMQENYISYFGEVVLLNKFSDFGWENGTPYFTFLGGEKVYDASPWICILRASVLVPFLWDVNFIVKDGYRGDKLASGYFADIIADFTTKCWRE